MDSTIVYGVLTFFDHPNSEFKPWNWGSTVTNHCRWVILYPPVSSNMAMENTLFIAVIFSNETPISSGFVIFLLKPPFLVDLPACHVWWHRRVWGVLNLPGLRLWTARTKGIPFSFATRIKKIVTLQGFSKHCPHIADHFGMTICIYTYIHGVYIYIYMHSISMIS